MARNTIKIKRHGEPVQEEMIANAAITPGHLCEEMSTGKVRVHATSGGDVLPMFAVEDELQGEGITDAYAAADPVQLWIPRRGDQVYALLANGQNAVIGSKLSSNGDGTLKVYTADTVSSDEPAYTDYQNSIVGEAVDAVDMSDSSGVDPSGRIIVRIL